MNSFQAHMRGLFVGAVICVACSFTGIYAGSNASSVSSEDMSSLGFIIGAFVGLIAGYSRFIVHTADIINDAHYNIEGSRRAQHVLWDVREYVDVSFDPEKHWSWSHKHTFFKRGIPLYLMALACAFTFGGGVLWNPTSLVLIPIAWFFGKFSSAYAQTLCDESDEFFYKEPEKIRLKWERVRAEEQHAKTVKLLQQMQAEQAAQRRLEAGDDGSYRDNSDIQRPWGLK